MPTISILRSPEALSFLIYLQVILLGGTEITLVTDSIMLHDPIYVNVSSGLRILVCAIPSFFQAKVGFVLFRACSSQNLAADRLVSA